jgi:hypothetical protein
MTEIGVKSTNGMACFWMRVKRLSGISSLMLMEATVFVYEIRVNLYYCISVSVYLNGSQGDPTFDTAQAIAVMLEKHGIACDMMDGFNCDRWTPGNTGKPTQRLALIPAAKSTSSNRKTARSAVCRW